MPEYGSLNVHQATMSGNEKARRTKFRTPGFLISRLISTYP
jgi:hypothetical protein